MACAADGSLQLAIRHRQVHQPGRDGCVRRRLARRRAVDRAIESRARRHARRHRPSARSPTRSSSRCEVIRFALAPNDVVPISFEWTFEAAVPPALEQREHHRSRDGFRLDADIVRYHHTGTASGWVEVDGVRTRAHRLGLDPRPLVGRALSGRHAARRCRADARCPTASRMLVLWCPVLCDAPGRHRGTRCTGTTNATRSATGPASRCRAASSTPTAGASRSSRWCPTSRSATTTGASRAARST